MEQKFINFCAGKGIPFGMESILVIEIFPDDFLQAIYKLIILIESEDDIFRKEELAVYLRVMYKYISDSSFRDNIFGKINYLPKENPGKDIVSSDDSNSFYNYAFNKLFCIDYLIDNFNFDRIAELYRSSTEILFELLYISHDKQIKQKEKNYIYQLVATKIFETNLKYQLDKIKETSLF